MIINKKFNLNINIYDSVIQNVMRIEEFISEEVKRRYIHKRLREYIPLELIDFTYFYPKKNVERTENNRQFVIALIVNFKCLRLHVNEIITNLTLDNKNVFEEFILLHKDYPNVNRKIRITAIELNINQKYNSTNNQCKILRTKILEREEYTTINCIVEKVNYPYAHFFRPKDIQSQPDDYLEIMSGINSEFKFQISNKKLNIKELYNHVISLPYEEAKMTFNANNTINIDENKGKRITTDNEPAHFNTILIELYNIINH